MANPYTTVSISGYNANPPPDDGSSTADNEITWAKHKTKLADPIKTALEAINTNVLAAFAKQFGNSVSAISSTYTVLSSDQGKVLSVTNGPTITLVSAASVGANFAVAVYNAGTSNVTLDGSGSETINGAATLSLIPGAGALLFSDGTNFTALIMSNEVVAPKGHIFGLTLSNNSTDSTNDIDIAAGEASSDSSTPAKMTLSAAITKRLDASWAVGTNQGGLDTGSKANDTFYSVWLIQRSDTGVVDVLFSASATSPTMPTDYDRKRRIGWIRTNSSGGIRGFNQTGDEFMFQSGIFDVDATIGTSASTHTMTVPVSCQGIFQTGSVNNAQIYISATSQTDEAPSTSGAPMFTLNSNGSSTYIGSGIGRLYVRVDGSRQIRSRASSAGTQLRMATLGFVDTRGKDA